MHLTLNIPPKLGRYSNDELFELCLANPDLRIERNANFELIFMSPTGFLSSRYNSKLTFILELWNTKSKGGIVADSNGGYLLQDGSMKVPDVAWLSNGRLNKTTLEEQKKFLPACPDFVIELKSETDRLQDLQAKMDGWIANGVELGWLIDMEEKVTYVYSSTSEIIEEVSFESLLTGKETLKGFEVRFSELFG